MSILLLMPVTCSCYRLLLSMILVTAINKLSVVFVEELSFGVLFSLLPTICFLLVFSLFCDSFLFVFNDDDCQYDIFESWSGSESGLVCFLIVRYSFF